MEATKFNFDNPFLSVFSQYSRILIRTSAKKYRVQSSTQMRGGIGLKCMNAGG